MPYDLVIGAPEARWRSSYDLPGGKKRIVIGSRGIEYTMVNGTMIWENGQQTGRAQGRYYGVDHAWRAISFMGKKRII